MTSPDELVQQTLGDVMDVIKMGMIQLQNPSHPGALLQKANQMRLAGTLCDVVILVDGQEFHAHRTVLACTSKMFEILFHRSSQHYTLDFLSPKTFHQILEYAYTATLQARAEDLDDLLYAAEILEIEYLEEQCLKILETIQASSDDNDGEVAVHDRDGVAMEEDGERRVRLGRAALVPKKHSTEGEEVAGAGGGYGYIDAAAQQQLALAAMVDRGPSVSTSFGLTVTSPTKAAVDCLMSIGHSLLQGTGEAQSGPRRPMTKVKAEAMQIDETLGREGTPDPGEKNGEADRSREGPGTPTRGSVITSARGLHYTREDSGGDPAGDGGPMGSEGVAGGGGPAEKHPQSLYPGPPNHKSDPLLSMSSSVGPPLQVPPSLAMSMDFSAYGGLLPQAFIQREFFSKLGEYTGRGETCGQEPR
ncbi:hypothetical protein AGOR_G00124300 [Albula goreensis]|uniref:BTB domain-containing protein n=1 Tax=Albula goreensis TaxID=1534307 RepID=A0A8T3DCJ8_9TELE|nr:hypothetical protein AGOR_G00124300 [Albula goreensis]